MGEVRSNFYFFRNKLWNQPLRDGELNFNFVFFNDSTTVWPEYDDT